MFEPEIIHEETQRESIINRPHNLTGSVKRILKERFSFSETEIVLKQTNVVPALIKLYSEALDNSVDVAIKSDFVYANMIECYVGADTITVVDNGYGISSEVDANGEHIIKKAFCNYNTSSNYKYEENTHKGTNGLGVKLCATLSTYLLAVSDDGKAKVTLEATENNLNHSIKKEKSKKKGTLVSFKPDFRIFDTEELDEEHIQRMYEYTLIQSLTYPKITFKFNEKLLKYTPKKFLSLFNKDYVLHEHDNYFLAVLPNEHDDFKQISYVNGLETARGGSHVDYIIDNLTSSLREKLVKKYKTIKQSDIKHKLMLVLIAKNFKNLNWDGQTKESITNPKKDMSAYFGDIDFDKLSEKIYKTQNIIDPITEVYKIKEELKKRQEMKGLEKTKKKIKSEKYLPAIGQKKYIFIVEGQSACGGLIPVLGRKDASYYSLKGKPMNVLTATHEKFRDNKELTELYQIIKNEFELEDMPDGDFYEITIGGETMIVNENDTVLINGEWIEANKLIKKESK